MKREDGEYEHWPLTEANRALGLESERKLARKGVH
jgi:hypothetical protein